MGQRREKGGISLPNTNKRLRGAAPLASWLRTCSHAHMDVGMHVPCVNEAPAELFKWQYRPYIVIGSKVCLAAPPLPWRFSAVSRAMSATSTFPFASLPQHASDIVLSSDFVCNSQFSPPIFNYGCC